MARAIASLPHRVSRIWLVAAVLVPLAVCLAFPHPLNRPIVPETLLLGIAAVLTLRVGVVPGLVSVASGTLALWFFNLAPGYSFKLDHAEDIAAVVASCMIGVAVVLLLSYMLQRERQVSADAARLEAQVSEQRQTISTMQRALLPEKVPYTPRLSVAWHYETGGNAVTPVGGDWLAFIPFSDARIGIAIGDVAGHGLRAVATMAQYRFALRSAAAGPLTPAEVLARVDEVANFYDTGSFSTCVYGVIDVMESTWRYSDAGHPPPLLVRHGLVTSLSGPHGPPLGIRTRSQPFGEAVISLKDDDLLVLYTDGVVERRGEPIQDGIERLTGALARLDPAIGLTEVPQCIAHDVAGDSAADDVAIIVAQFHAEPSGAEATRRA